jgi:hypothetical protein
MRVRVYSQGKRAEMVMVQTPLLSYLNLCKGVLGEIREFGLGEEEFEHEARGVFSRVRI